MSQRNQVLEALWRLEQMDVVNMPENTMPKGTLDRLEDLEEAESNTAKLDGEKDRARREHSSIAQYIRTAAMNYRRNVR